MPFLPFPARVRASRRISPNFQRVTLSGLADMGPSGPIRDLRIKLIIPGPEPITGFAGAADWFATWRGLDPRVRGDMRTYSIRARRGDKVDIDFALHVGASPGPASAWAESCQPGDTLWLIGPTADDSTGSGIEFQPGNSERALLFGDETALPAIARVLDEWPAGLTGHAFIEVPDAADAEAQARDIALPDRVELTWLIRDKVARGSLLTDALREAVAAGSGHAEAGEAEKTTSPAKPAPAGEARDAAEPDGGAALVWETPQFSSSGETLPPAGPALRDYYWIAGESGVVTGMRRYLVKECGIDRRQVSFMGYWRLGRAGS
ncbi:siderophore-interacting protein [Corynebacterium confusum]|uniref:siderophore-interacting protein n=1 Tax=Corynebacterium confusum TaxID=71254 RepID=UPI0025B3BF5B|nr:siderophore-interacting protein [Corynebacterium confusum]WJY89078.1 Vibriobactin utilization protein ViuB [Corynebacterium confusum]